MTIGIIDTFEVIKIRIAKTFRRIITEKLLPSSNKHVIFLLCEWVNIWPSQRY